MVHMVQDHQRSACAVYKPHRYWHLIRRDGVWDRLLTSTGTSFDASITGDELYSAVQLPNFRSVVAWHAACMMLCIAQG